MSNEKIGKGLSEKQRKFALEYLKDFNASRAYRDAGYSKKFSNSNVTKLLQNTALQKYLAGLTKKQTDKAEVSVQWVIKELKEIHRRCTEGRLEGKTAVRSLELLGKYLGMWIEKHEHKVESSLELLLKKIEDESERGLPKTKA